MVPAISAEVGEGFQALQIAFAADRIDGVLLESLDRIGDGHLQVGAGIVVVGLAHADEIPTGQAVATICKTTGTTRRLRSEGA